MRKEIQDEGLIPENSSKGPPLPLWGQLSTAEYRSTSTVPVVEIVELYILYILLLPGTVVGKGMVLYPA